MTTGLFVFRRDLRIEDNVGLRKMASTCTKLYCVFILDDRQVNPKKNKYHTYNGLMFMFQSIKELSSRIYLTVASGLPHEVIPTICTKHKINIVGYNRDYTPFSLLRDKEIKDACNRANIKVMEFDDCYLNSPERIKPYKVFTPYYLVAKRLPVDKPTKTPKLTLHKLAYKNVKLDALIKEVKKNMGDVSIQEGGRSAGISLLKQFVKDRCKTYAKGRDQLTFKTSRLSAHIKFGTLSIREIYYSCASAVFRKELYWRDFYMQVGYYFPNVFGENFKGKIKWSVGAKADRLFDAWCAGRTGYDIVDACMMQLNRTGHMHNRGRMIVASFLTKILHIDWRKGELYFAKKLTDYDPCSNNGGWQWSAGTGVDAQPYFRIFNPMLQAERYDADGSYRETWLGAGWQEKYSTMEKIANYEEERDKALALYTK